MLHMQTNEGIYVCVAACHSVTMHLNTVELHGKHAHVHRRRVRFEVRTQVQYSCSLHD